MLYLRNEFFEKNMIKFYILEFLNKLCAICIIKVLNMKEENKKVNSRINYKNGKYQHNVFLVKNYKRILRNILKIKVLIVLINI